MRVKEAFTEKLIADLGKQLLGGFFVEGGHSLAPLQSKKREMAREGVFFIQLKGLDLIRPIINVSIVGLYKWLGSSSSAKSMTEKREFPAFPYKPYSIQIDFMNALYQFLDKGGVSMLESPTGII